MNVSGPADRLALHGGPPVRSAPWPPRALFGREEKEAACSVFDRLMKAGMPIGYQGQEEEAYGREFVGFMGQAGFTDMVNSGTSAVYVALKALDLEPFSEVIVPAFTNAGGCMPVPLVNCIPVPADCAPGTQNVDAREVERRLSPRAKVIIVSHMGGVPVDMDPVLDLARERNLSVIEDCAQSHGAEYKGRKVGGLGDMGAFSIMFGKMHAAGGQGGVVYTRDEDLYWRIRRAADRGKRFGREPDETTCVTASLNLNMDELGAAIARVQLRKLPGMIRARRALGAAIMQGCGELKAVRPVGDPPYGKNVFWFLLFDLDLSRLTVDGSGFMKALEAEGISGEFGFGHEALKMPWARERAVFGSSGYPWLSPEYKGDPDREFPTPNTTDIRSRRLRVRMHERCGDREVADVLTALHKVEKAFLA